MVSCYSVVYGTPQSHREDETEVGGVTHEESAEASVWSDRPAADLDDPSLWLGDGGSCCGPNGRSRLYSFEDGKNARDERCK